VRSGKKPASTGRVNAPLSSNVDLKKKPILMANHEYLERFIDIIFAFILAYVVNKFTTTFQIGTISWEVKDIGRTIIFLSAVTILIYDWVAYHLLIKLLPYRKENYFIRFLLDLGIFFVMYLLFHAVLEDINFYMALITILFVLIFIWHFLAYILIDSSGAIGVKSKQKCATKTGMCNSGVSVVLSAIILLLLYFLPLDVIDSSWRNVAVGIAIIVYCMYRYKKVINNS